MKNQTAQEKTQEKLRVMTAGQMKEIISSLVESIPSNLSFEVAEQIVGSKREVFQKR